MNNEKRKTANEVSVFNNSDSPVRIPVKNLLSLKDLITDPETPVKEIDIAITSPEIQINPATGMIIIKNASFGCIIR